MKAIFFLPEAICRGQKLRIESEGSEQRWQKTYLELLLCKVLLVLFSAFQRRFVALLVSYLGDKGGGGKKVCKTDRKKVARFFEEKSVGLLLQNKEFCFCWRIFFFYFFITFLEFSKECAILGSKRDCGGNWTLKSRLLPYFPSSGLPQPLRGKNEVRNDAPL